MKAVFKHEVSLYYHGLMAYVFAAFLLEFIGIGAMLYNINSAVIYSWKSAQISGGEKAKDRPAAFAAAHHIH